MKILLLGHNGYLGNYINKNFTCDILDKKNVYPNGKTYDYVINCIGKPDVDFCEKNEAVSQYSNCDVILDIKKFYPKSKIINFSSYYCYDYSGACDENSPVTEKYNYMRHKINGEQHNRDGINLRIGKLFGNKEKEQGKFFDYIIKNDELICDEIFFNPCSVYCINEFLKLEFSSKNTFGTYNLANNGCPTHYEFAKFVSEFFSNKNIKRIDKLKRNFSNYGNFYMDLTKIKKIFEPKYWQYDVEKYFETS